MPPKTCSSRNKVKFDKFAGFVAAGKPASVTNLLARALLTDGYLSQFKGQINASECVFSYPDNDWYSVYLLDESGEKYWDSETGKHKKYYFKILTSPDGREAAIDTNTASTTPPQELLYPDGTEMENCILTEGGNCGNPPGRKKAVAPKKEKEPKTPSTSKKTTKKVVSASPEVLVGTSSPTESPEEILARITQIQAGSGSGSSVDLPKAKIERSYFENLGSKELIVDWMIKNMNHSDILKCIQRGNLTPEQVKQAEAVAGVEVGMSGTAAAISDEELNFITEALGGLSTKDAKEALTKVTKGELVAFLNKITDPGKKAQKIVALCKYAGIKKYTIEQKSGRGGKTIYKIKDGEFELTPEEFNDIIDECASKEAMRVAKILKLRSISKDYKAQTSMQQKSLTGKAPENKLISEIKSLKGDPRKLKIVELCNSVGKTNVTAEPIQTRKGPVLRVYEDGEELDDEEIDALVTQCSKMQVTSFGKKRRKVSKIQSNFKKAAKQCKKSSVKSGYRRCMKKTLRKMYKS